ncbi:hypothetical protein POL68_24175 [Stigmatella sp. ncwal1]|uniref:Uncharacterized protein n=1 Tax=Stigmatella ashevillensis TaxID=2995309 RepID=A0ABT5DDA9_9BACT|nr:hypothetical protein [Stigmatella ashevillena]MDC0711589.1 hypothetical protein [Stigmatella ashevillena]
MHSKLVFAAATLLLSTSAFAEEDLKPAQEEAKAAFEEQIEEYLKPTNEKCGTKLTVKADFENFKAETWSASTFASYCGSVLEGIQSMCERPAYKKAISKKVKSVACLLAGAKPAEKNDGSNGAALRNMSLSNGVFTYHASQDQANLSDNTKTTLEKAFN